jgi:hypothetical protein
VCDATADRTGAAASGRSGREYFAAPGVPGDRDLAGDRRCGGGIRFVNGSGRSETLDADLVVDASGRAAPTLTLFDALGWDRPQMTEIAVAITYATAVVEIPPHATTEWKAVLTLPDPPHVALRAIVVPTEDGRWITAIADHGATAKIESWDALLEASRSLITPTVYNALRYVEPPEGIRHYRFPVSTWKHFERLH